MNLLAFWVNTLDPVAIHFPASAPIPGIYWYGIAYFLGVLAVFFSLNLYNKKGFIELGIKDQSDLVSETMLGMLLGGRLGYYILYHIETLVHNPLIIFKIWEGGMASHGAFIGIILALTVFCKKRHKPLLIITDAFTTAVPIGFFLGRLANFVNGELWGRVSYKPWAVIFPKSAFPNCPLSMILPRHPSQLYEAALEGVLLFLYLNHRFWHSKLKKYPLPEGQVSAEFLVGYGIVRIIGECFREPDAGLILGMSRGQFYSVLLIFFGCIVYIYSRKRASLIKR